MARRITQFFSSVPIKNRKIDEQLNQEELPKVSIIYSDLSSNDSENNRNGCDPTSNQTESNCKISIRLQNLLKQKNQNGIKDQS